MKWWELQPECRCKVSEAAQSNGGSRCENIINEFGVGIRRGRERTDSS